MTGFDLPELDHPGLVMRQISAIEADLAERQNRFEEAVGELSGLHRDWEFVLQTTFLTTDGTVREREAKTLTAAVAANSELYQQLKDREAEVAATKSVVRVLEQRASALQSVLRAQTREAFGNGAGVQPAWSHRGS